MRVGVSRGTAQVLAAEKMDNAIQNNGGRPLSKEQWREVRAGAVVLAVGSGIFAAMRQLGCRRSPLHRSRRRPSRAELRHRPFRKGGARA